jgi:glycosyltransferase involved in cell wall biosynthesis
MALSLKWNGPFMSTYSYGEVCRNYVLALDEIGARVKIRSYRERKARSFKLEPSVEERLKKLKRRRLKPPYVNVTFEYPVHAVQDIAAEKNISFFVMEYDRCERSWHDSARWCDEFWVPSHFNYLGAAKSGFPPNKLHVIPHGVDVERFRPNLEPLVLKGKRGFAFLAVSIYHPRKGWDLLVRAFAEEFKAHEDVCLICKTTQPRMLFEASMPYLRGSKAPELVVLNRSIATDEMPALYAAADCFVLPSRAEGWGMCYLEAMAAGLPVIGTRYSGQLDFMSDGNSLLVDLVELRPDQLELRDSPAMNMAEPDLDDLRRKMRMVYEDRELAHRLGASARSAAERFTWVNQAELIRERCKCLLGEGEPPSWGLQPLEVQACGPDTDCHILDVILFANDNTYLLSRTLKAWQGLDCPARVWLVGTSSNQPPPDFIKHALSSGLAYDHRWSKPGESPWQCAQAICRDCEGPYIHLGAFDRYPTDDSGILRALAVMEEDPSVAAVGGFVISPYATLVLGPFRRHRGELDRSLLDKGVRSKMVSNALKTDSVSAYIHYQAMILRSCALAALGGLPEHRPGLRFSIDLCDGLTTQGGKLLTVGSFLIESQEFLGSPLLA